MSKDVLKDDMKNRLRSLVPGLKNGSVKTEWNVFSENHTIKAITGLGDRELWTNVWKGVTWADFDDLVEHRFFRHKGNGSYTLNEQLIIDACERDFSSTTSEMQSSITTLNILNSAGTINVQSILKDVTQTIHNAPAKNDSFTQKLGHLVEQLKQHLETTSSDYRLDAEAIETIIQLIKHRLDE